MPRWPGGLHRAGGTGVAYGGQPIRPDATQMEGYWRQTQTELLVGANAIFINPTGGGNFVQFGAPIAQRAAIGPTAAGERWQCQLVQVTIGQPAIQGLVPPLVTQQQSAQSLGTTSTPPPPIVAQAWLSASGTLLHLLAQSTQGVNDTMDLGGQIITAGEAITVLWWSTSLSPGFPGAASMNLRGTRYALSVI